MNPRHPLALLLVSVVALVVLAVAIVAVPPAQAAGANGSGPLYLPLVSGRGATEEPGVYTLAGVVQKGPFVQGTEITVRELDGTLTPTGRTFTGRIDDNSGRFSVRSVLDYPFVELAAEGFYYNEVSDRLSTARITLLALVDVRDGTTVNVNLLTHLERARVLALVDSGVSLAAAKAQAQREVLALFNLAGAIGYSETLDIAKGGAGNALLLAVSVILQSDRSEAQLTELLSILSSDLGPDGDLDSPQARQALLDGMEYVKPSHAAIRANIIARYTSLGAPVSVPPFEDHAVALDDTPPEILSTEPVQDFAGVVDTASITFNDLIAHSTVTAASVRLLDAGNNPVNGALHKVDGAGGTTVRFTPSTRLPAGDYRFVVGIAVQDLAGNALAQEFALRFRITPPTPAPTSVPPTATPAPPTPTATAAPTATATPTSVPPVEMALVSGGTFQMGCDDANDPASCAYGNELPLHSLTLSAYSIDKVEVSNAHYQQCVAAGQCTAPKETNSWTHYPYYGVPAYANYPVINVTWNQAAQYCQWLGKRLPTEAEWEFAARGSSGNRVYPWGDTAPDCSKVNYGPLEGQCVGDAAPVGSYPAGASSFGVLDMSGNVWEWVSDWYSATYYAGSPAGDPTGPATGTERVMRGGAWNNYDVLFLRVARRGSGLPDYFADSVGFRCAQ